MAQHVVKTQSARADLESQAQSCMPSHDCAGPQLPLECQQLVWSAGLICTSFFSCRQLMQGTKHMFICRSGQTVDMQH